MTESPIPAPQLSPPPPCVPASSLPPGGLARFRRFAVLPHGYGEWRERDCFPRHLDAAALARTIEPYGVVVSVAGHDAVVVDPGPSWLLECRQSGLPVSGVRTTTGADLLRVIDHIARHPGLSMTDIREIGLGTGNQAGGEPPIYSLTLGTPRAVARVQCFEDIEILVERAAAALKQAREAAVW